MDFYCKNPFFSFILHPFPFILPTLFLPLSIHPFALPLIIYPFVVPYALSSFTEILYLVGDDAVMELALALSLQDQDNDNFDDDDADEEDDDDEADDDVDLEDDTDGPLPSERYDSLMQENQPLIGKNFTAKFGSHMWCDYLHAQGEQSFLSCTSGFALFVLIRLQLIVVQHY